jgi:hypothetical protein
MLRSIVYLALVLFTSETFAVSAFQSRPHRSRDDLSSPQTINSTIYSANGTDLTSSFRTMIYFQSNKTDYTGLSDRQVSFSRPINTCRCPNTTFIRSFCKHQVDQRGMYSLQEYRVFCHDNPRPIVRTPRPGGGYNVKVHVGKFRREEGACTQEEICVDGAGADEVAYCVSKENFVRLIQRGEKTARTIISQADESTPLEVQGIDLQAGFIGNMNEDKPIVQERKCRYCFELRTQKMAEGTNFLQTEASLMTAATVAAGVVWLIISG